CTTLCVFFVAVQALRVSFIFTERRVAEPMMDLALFRIRTFWAGNTSLFLSALARGATMFILTWYFQVVQHLTTVDTGLRLIPWALSMMISAPIFGRFSDRTGSRY